MKEREQRFLTVYKVVCTLFSMNDKTVKSGDVDRDAVIVCIAQRTAKTAYSHYSNTLLLSMYYCN